MAFFENFCFGACLFFLGYNLESRKFMMLFDLKWVSRQDSIGCSSFFGQILSFRPPRWQFFENFHFDARFCFSQNLDLYKFLQLFDWKWVNGQDSIGCSSFFGQIPSFQPRKWHFFFEKFHFSALFFLRQNSGSRIFVKLFNWKWVNGQDSIVGSSCFSKIQSFRPPK